MNNDRHKARLLAVQALYMFDQSKSCSRENLLQFPWMSEEELSGYQEKTLVFARLMITGTIENLQIIDETITSLLINWDFSRLSIVDLSILRLSFYSLLFQQDIPHKVTINESVLLSQELSGPTKAYTFINGILDAYIRRERIKHDTVEK